MDLLATNSYDDITIEQICQTAGVGRATFFRIYQSKADLLIEFNKRLAERVQQRLNESGTSNVEVALSIVGTEIADSWRQTTPGATALAIDFSQMAGSRGLHTGHPELLRIVTDIIEAGLKNEELECKLPAALMGSLALVQISAPVTYWFRHPERNLDELISEAIHQWLHGVKTNS